MYLQVLFNLNQEEKRLGNKVDDEYYFLIGVEFLLPNIILFEQCEVHGSRLAFFKHAASLWPKLYIPSTLNIDYLHWHTQLIVCAVKH